MNIFQAVEQAARQHGLSFVVIGGLAVIEHGYARLTADFDLLVWSDEKARWDALLTGLGYKLVHDREVFRQYAAREEGSWPVDLMFVKEATFQGICREAKAVAIQGIRLPMISLENLFMLKLHALKHSNLQRFLKDFDDVVHLVQINRIDLHSSPMRDLFLKYGDAELYGKISRACESK